MRVISVVNQKGGCGKTTLSVNIAAALAKMGKEILFIDLDPQAHATYALGYEKKASTSKTSYDLFKSHIDQTTIELKELIIKDRPKFSLIPSNMLLSTAEINLGNIDGAAAILHDALQGEEYKNFDYVIIDSPPNFGFLTLNAMYPADVVLTPIDLSYFSFNAVNSVYRVTSILGNETGKKPEVYFVMNIFDGRSNFAKKLEEACNNKLGKFLLKTKVRASVRLRESSGYGKTIFEHDPKCASSLDFYNLTTEIINMENAKEEDVVLKEFFIHAPKARDVYILGDFNGWKRTEENRLTRFDDGKWSTHFNLKKGRYRYKYLVDGEWIHDQSNPEIETNIFGSKDSIASV